MALGLIAVFVISFFAIINQPYTIVGAANQNPIVIFGYPPKSVADYGQPMRGTYTCPAYYLGATSNADANTFIQQHFFGYQYQLVNGGQVIFTPQIKAFNSACEFANLAPSYCQDVIGSACQPYFYAQGSSVTPTPSAIATPSPHFIDVTTIPTPTPSTAPCYTVTGSCSPTPTPSPTATPISTTGATLPPEVPQDGGSSNFLIVIGIALVGIIAALLAGVI